MTNERSKLKAIWIACIAMFLALVAYKVTTWVKTWRTTYVVGTFQGMFSFDLARVRVAPDQTGLVIAKVEGRGGPSWMRFFSGLSPGRAAQHVVLPDLSVVVVGVFDRELRSSEPTARPLLRTEEKQGIFTIRLRSDGRLIAKKLLASGEEFATPVIKFHHDGFAVDVRHSGKLSVGGKAADEGIDSPTLHLELSPSGEVLRWQATRGEERNPPVTPRAAMLSPSGTCEVCRWYTPKDDMNCGTSHSSGTVKGIVCNSPVNDPWCCQTGWDRQCMDEGVAAGVQGTTCTCAHSPHDEGELLPPLCPGPIPNCVATVDQEDTVCGWGNPMDPYDSWDNQCVDEANICP